MRRTGAPVVTELIWSAPDRVVFKTRSCSSAATSLTEATVRRAGALVALAAASVLVHLLLFPADDEIKLGIMAVYAIVLLGCAAVLISPAHRAVAELAHRSAGKIFGAAWRAAAELLSAPARVIEAARSPSGELAAPPTEAAVRWSGALVSLAAASALLLLVVPDHAAVVASDINGGVLALYAVFLLGCAALLLSPAYAAVADLARRAEEEARKFSGATFLRWTGFACICVVFYAIRAVGDARAEAAAATVVMSSEQYALLFMFLLFLVGVWTVSLSTVTGRAPPTLPVRLPLPPPPPVQDEHGCGVVNGTAAPADARDGVLFSKV